MTKQIRVPCLCFLEPPVSFFLKKIKGLDTWGRTGAVPSKQNSFFFFFKRKRSNTISLEWSMRLKCGAETLSPLLFCCCWFPRRKKRTRSALLCFVCPMSTHWQIATLGCIHYSALALCGNYAWMLSSRVDSFTLDVTCVSFLFFLPFNKLANNSYSSSIGKDS